MIPQRECQEVSSLLVDLLILSYLLGYKPIIASRNLEVNKINHIYPTCFIGIVMLA